MVAAAWQGGWAARAREARRAQTCKGSGSRRGMGKAHRVKEALDSTAGVACPKMGDPGPCSGCCDDVAWRRGGRGVCVNCNGRLVGVQDLLDWGWYTWYGGTVLGSSAAPRRAHRGGGRVALEGMRDVAP